MTELAFPYGIDGRGRTADAGRDEHIRELIEQLLLTAPGERVNRPSFGAGLLRLIQEGMISGLSAATQTLVLGSLQATLGELIDVSAVRRGSDRHRAADHAQLQGQGDRPLGDSDRHPGAHMSSVQAICTREERLATLRAKADPAHNAIDWLEVLPSKRALALHCVASVPALTVEQVSISGGVRVLGIRVLSVDVASGGAPPWLPAADAAVLGSWDATTRERTLLVQSDSSGDFSTYVLTLSASESSPTPPPGFDPLLSSIAFSFRVDCPSDFDCAPPACEPGVLPPAPPLDYLSRDFTSLRQLMLGRLSQTSPTWNEPNPSDLGIAIVEAIAYRGDQLSYRQDAAATEAYLETARRRSSVRRHAALLDYVLHDGASARAWLAFTVGPAADGSTLARSAQVTTGDAVLGQGRAPAAIAASGGIFFETAAELVLREAHNVIEPYTWGDDACCLPAGSTSLTVVDPGTLKLEDGDVLILAQRLAPGGVDPDATDPGLRHAVALRAVGAQATDPLSGTVVRELSWSPADATPFDLDLTLVQGRCTTCAIGNVVLADHGLAFSESTPPVPQAGRFRPTLSQGPLTQSVAFDACASAAASMNVDPRAALPAITANDGGETWKAQPTLLDGDRFTAAFVAETEDEAATWLRFGDGVVGRAPEVGRQFALSYRFGTGTPGNVGADSLTQLVAPFAGVSAVTNPLAATGGTDPEPLIRARQDAPVAFRTQERAVSAADYAMIAERHPEVQRAVGHRRWTGSWHTTFITVERVGGAAVDEAVPGRTRGVHGVVSDDGHRRRDPAAGESRARCRPAHAASTPPTRPPTSSRPCCASCPTAISPTGGSASSPRTR